MMRSSMPASSCLLLVYVLGSWLEADRDSGRFSIPVVGGAHVGPTTEENQLKIPVK
jgi:hypothetical protein